MINPFRNTKIVPLVFLMIIMGMVYYGLTRRNLNRVRSRYTIITSLPVTYTLTHALTQNTGLEADVVTVDVPRADAAGYFRSNEPRLAKQLADADIVVSLRSVWPQDPLYPYVRRANIRALEVDAANPVEPGRAGIQPFDGATRTYVPWHSIRQVIEMTGILAEDFCRLGPRYRTIIRRDAAAMQKQLSTMRSELMVRYKPYRETPILVVSPDFTPMLKEMGLNVAAELVSNGQRLDQISTANCRLAVVKSSASVELKKELAQLPLVVVELDGIERLIEPDPESFFKRLGQNHAKLLAALATE